jgi:hypothetical protein
MRTLVVAAAVLATSACSAIVGNGNVTTEPRTVGAFTKLEVDSALNVTASLGARAVTITTDQNLQQYVEAAVVGDTLRLRVTPGVSIGFPSRLEATVANDVLEGVVASGAVHVTGVATPVTALVVTASGASTVTLTSVAATSITADATGASQVTLSGTATSGSLVAEGASLVDTRGVPLTTASVSASGASTIKARVSSTLSGLASGASSVLITGTPASTASASGSSTVQLGQP